MTWVDSLMLFLLISQFAGVVKLLYLAGQQTAEIREVRRRVGALEARNARLDYRDHPQIGS